MDDTCWRVVGLAGGVVAGLAAAVGVLWRAYRGMVRALLEEKEAKVRLLEGFKRYVETRSRKQT